MLVLYFTKELARLVKQDGITVNAVHPGSVATNVFREFPNWLAKLMGYMLSKPEDGAKGSVLLASSKDVAPITGQYFFKTKQKETTDKANDMELAKLIRLKTEELTGIKYK